MKIKYFLLIFLTIHFIYLSFGVSDNSQNLIFYSANPNLLTDVQQTNTEIDQAQNIQTFVK